VAVLRIAFATWLPMGAHGVPPPLLHLFSHARLTTTAPAMNSATPFLASLFASAALVVPVPILRHLSEQLKGRWLISSRELQQGRGGCKTEGIEPLRFSKSSSTLLNTPSTTPLTSNDCFGIIVCKLSCSTAKHVKSRRGRCSEWCLRRLRVVGTLCFPSAVSVYLRGACSPYLGYIF